MNRTSKTVSWLCIFSTLFMGCYSHTTLTADSPKSEYEVQFQLKDGTHVTSSYYERVENGYRVVGRLANNENTISKDFSGILLDAQIKRVVTTEFDGLKTVGAVLFVVGVVVVIIGGVVKAYSNQK